MYSNLSQSTIMVIDDRPSNLNYLIDILSHQGYAIRVFPSGKLALKAAEKNPPDLILLDINMPEMNGYEVCVLLKAHSVLKSIPVIFISALTDTTEKVKAFACGGVDYITKPFEPEEVKARIKTHLQLARAEALKEATQRRLNIERQYYLQLDQFSHAIIHTNQHGIIVYCNPLVENYFGYSRRELIGQAIERLIPKDLQQSHLLHRKTYLENPTTRPMSEVKDILALKKNGDTLHVDISLSTLYSEQGLLVSAEIRDISESIRLKKELDIQRRLRDDGFNKTSDGIIVTDNKGFIIMTNPAITNLLGYEAAELIGKTTRFLYTIDDDGEAIASNLATDASLTNKPVTVNMVHKDTGQLTAEVMHIHVQDTQDEYTGTIHVLRDISERVRTEQERKSLLLQLMQAQKMESLGQLTGGIAHDFNNILASIMGFTELALELLQEEELQDGSENRARHLDYLGEIQTSGNRAQELIAQMLTFSRSGNNGKLHPFDLRILINETIKMLRPVLPASISIQATVQGDTPTVMVDPVQVHQLLMNVCINARDAMDGKGRIDVNLTRSTVNDGICTSCRQLVSGDHLELSVRDTGPGIDAKLLERIFEPFFTTKQVGKGTGMGLAMVHGIIHHHSGHIIVDSKPGLGTRFRILFPLDSPRVAQQTSKPSVTSDALETV